MESDDYTRDLKISIRSPHARGDKDRKPISKRNLTFQSAPLMRGETQRPQQTAKHTYFNPLPSCEGRQHKPPKILLDSRQSIQQKHHSSFF